MNEIELEVAEARHLWEWLLYDVELMLAHGRIHADLSAYNVLYTGGDFRIIDFPQCIDPAVHPDAYPIFLRDVTRLAQYFARQGVQADPVALARRCGRSTWGEDEVPCLPTCRLTRPVRWTRRAGGNQVPAPDGR